MALQDHMATDRIMEEWSTRSTIQLQQGHYKITYWHLTHVKVGTRPRTVRRYLTAAMIKALFI
jgi:hypothetical protein